MNTTEIKINMIFYIIMTAIVLTLNFYEMNLMLRPGTAQERLDAAIAESKAKFGDEAERMLKSNYVATGTVLLIIWLIYHSMIIYMAHSNFVTLFGIVMIMFTVYCHAMTIYIANTLTYKRPIMYTSMLILETGYIFIMLLCFITGTIK